MPNHHRAVSIFATAVLTALAVIVGVYFLNPLRTASANPRLRVTGYTMLRFPTDSMQPAIHPNDILVVSAWAYAKADPKPGDVIVFQFPSDRSVVMGKRVIAVGASTVEIQDGVTIVNGKRIDEPYVDPRNNVKEISRHTYSVRVPANALFVMGDNRDDSDDSRDFGVVPRSHVIGKVISVPGSDQR